MARKPKKRPARRPGENRRLAGSEKLFDLEWTWSARALAVTDAVTVYGIDAYSAPAMIVRKGTSASNVHSGTGFKYWTAVVVETDSMGRLYVDQIYTGVYDKTQLAASTANGFVLFIHDYTPTAAVGQFVAVSFDYKNTSGTSSHGFGTINFVTSAPKPAKDNTEKLQSAHRMLQN